MRINTNVASLTATRQLYRSQLSLSTSLERLSSGLRINSAKDDAAGLAIADRMTARIKGMNQAARNANDGISLLQTAEGALSSIDDVIQRIRELTVQAVNDTNSASDRHSIQVEISQLTSEITRIAEQTEFNGQKIFSQSNTSIVGDVDKRTIIDGLKLGWLPQAEDLVLSGYGLMGRGDKMYIRVSGFSDGAGSVAAYVGPPALSDYFQDLQIDMADFTPPNLPNGGSKPYYNDRIITHEMVHAIMNSALGASRTGAMPTWFLEGSAEFIHGADERVAADIAGSNLTTVVNTVANSWGSNSIDYSSAYIAVRRLHETLKEYGNADGMKALMTYLNDNTSATLDNAISALTGGAIASAAAFIASFTGSNASVGTSFVQTRMNLTNTDTGGIGGLDADNGDIKTAESVIDFGGRGYNQDVLLGFEETFEEVSGSAGSHIMTLHVGAESDQSLVVTVGAASAQALGLGGLNVTSSSLSTLALVRIDDALEYVNSQRSTLGAQLSRLSSAILTLQSTAQNTAASQSRIRDADFAQETADLTRSQILQQAGMSLLAQANSAHQSVLSLLR